MSFSLPNHLLIYLEFILYLSNTPYQKKIINHYYPLLIYLYDHLQGKVYLFDKVFKPNASQEKVYNEAAKSIVSGKFCFIISLSLHYMCFLFFI